MRENTSEEQSDRALSKNFHHTSTTTVMAKEIHKNHTLIRDDVSMDEISNCSSTMDLDGDSKTSNPPWMSMSCSKDRECAKSNLSMLCSAINMPRAAGITFNISKENAQRLSLKFLKLSQAAYGKLKQELHVKFFNQSSMMYMTVRVHHLGPTYRENHIMHVDEQEDGERKDNVIQFNEKLQEGHHKGKNRRTKKSRPPVSKGALCQPQGI